MPRHLTDRRRFSKDGKLLLAAWLGIKFAYGNSTLYGMSLESIVSFFHVRRDRARHLLQLMREDTELFYMNDRKDCIFANGCRDRKGKANRKGGFFKGDDVITFDVPECYLRPKDTKESMRLKDLVLLIEKALVCKEYDDQSGYKYKRHPQSGAEEGCETETGKTQVYVAKRTGLSRTKVGRILGELVNGGVLSRTSHSVEACRRGERYSFEAVDMRTGQKYWARCVPSSFSWKIKPFRFRHIIWDASKRCRSCFAKSPKNILNELRRKFPLAGEEELELKLMVSRQYALREAYD